MHRKTQDQHSQTAGICLLSHSPLSTNNLTFNTKFHRASSAMTFLSLSLSTPVPNCQANHHASGLNLKVTRQCKHPSSSTVPAHYRTSGVQHLIHVATKPRSLTKQTRPSVVLMPIFLNCVATKPGHRPFRVLMPIFLSSVATKPGHLPFRVLMPIFLNCMATKPRLLTILGSHANISTYHCNLQA